MRARKHGCRAPWANAHSGAGNGDELLSKRHFVAWGMLLPNLHRVALFNIPCRAPTVIIDVGV